MSEPRSTRWWEWLVRGGFVRRAAFVRDADAKQSAAVGVSPRRRTKRRALWCDAWFGAAIAFAFVVGVALGRGISNDRAKLARLRSSGYDAERRLEKMRATNPAPMPVNRMRIREELARVERDNAEAEATLAQARLRNEAREEAPMQRAEVFFELAALVEAMRASAREAGVKVRADERFGFAAFANEAPEASRVAAIHQECRLTRALLEALFEANPIELISVQRETTGPKGKGSRAASRSKSVSASHELFELDERISLRREHAVNATALCVTFVARTATLRRLIETLSEPDSPWFVRSVEAEPDVENRSRGRSGSPDEAVITREPTRFTVIVEAVALAQAEKESP